jgi:Carbohydrate esterase, sialic acid-specific acetylesterase
MKLVSRSIAWINRPRKNSTIYRILMRRPPKKLDPEFGSYRAIDDRKMVSPRLFQRSSPKLAVILAVGQSNIANEGDPKGVIQPTIGVYNFNLFDSRCYVARDPLLGPTGQYSNLATRIGDLLVRRGNFERTLLIPIAHGGTHIIEWLPEGRVGYRLIAAIDRVQQKGISITHVVWQQGEAEGAASHPDGRAWVANFNRIAQIIRTRGVRSPIYVSQCTMSQSGSSETIRAAQRSVVDPERGILMGPDMDTIGGEDRLDGCHFAASGLDKAAHLWVDALMRTRPL